MGTLNIQIPCWPCNGTGKISAGLDEQRNLIEVICPRCAGNKLVDWGTAAGIDDLIASLITLNSKIDAIKAMLDSPILGMQKMSSNLDDIMAKLDV